MADFEVRITDLPGANPLGGIELVPVVQDGETKTRSAQSVVSEAGLGAHISNSDPHPQYAFRVKNNLTATRDPDVNDDSSVGYEPTSRWVNTVTNEFFICVTDGVGTANWQQATLTLDELGSAALVDVGAGNGLDADLLDGQHGSYYQAWVNVTGKPSPVITVDGDITGSVTLTELASGTLTLSVVDDSHNHVISNVDGLQTALDSKVESVNGKTTNDITLVTDDISEDVSPANLWYTDSRVRNAISVSGDLGYDSLSGEISFSETYSTPSELLTAIKTVDGDVSGLDADLLDGQHGAFYQDASNLSTGSLPSARFTDTSHGNRAGGSLHANVTTTVDGFMSSADKTKLDGVEAGAQVNVATNLGQSRDGTSYTVTSSTGSDTTLEAATTTNAGVMSSADKTKLDGLGGSTIPVGIISLWSGAVLDIPSGWALCDGLNGTPDLRNRFVVGAGDTYAVGAVGGSADAVVVSHSHSASTNSAGYHNHSGSTNTTGNHSHYHGTPNNPAYNMVYGSTSYGSTSYNRASTRSSGSLITSSSSGNHSHTLSINSNGSHSHTVTVNSTGETGVGKNLPPYYALAYIMKT